MLASLYAHFGMSTLYLYIVGFLSSMVWGGIYVLFHNWIWLFHILLRDCDLFLLSNIFAILDSPLIRQPKGLEKAFGRHISPLLPCLSARSITRLMSQSLFAVILSLEPLGIGFAFVWSLGREDWNWCVVQRIKAEGLPGTCSSKLETECSFQCCSFYIEIFIQKIIHSYPFAVLVCRLIFVNLR